LILRRFFIVQEQLMSSSIRPQPDLRRIAGEILSQLLNVPVLTGILITYLYARMPANLPNLPSSYARAMLFLCLLPLSSLLFYIPGKTREWEKVVRRQRIASFAFMLVSYPAGVLALYLNDAPRIFEALAVIYSLVTLGLIVFNLIFRYKASGHAAGVAGPVAALIYLYGLVAAPLLALLPLVTWARVAAQGHSAWQTVVGAALSLTIGISVLYAYGFLPFIGQIR
jgi:hypothetical protein